MTRLLKVAALIVAAVGVSGSARANLVANGSFELPALGSAAVQRFDSSNDEGTFGWTVTTGEVDVLKPGNFADGRLPSSANTGSQYLDLNGLVGNSPGGISQTLSLVNGREYQFSFAYAGTSGTSGNPSTSFEYTVHGVTTLIENVTSTDWTTITETFVYNGSDNDISFLSVLTPSQDFAGVNIDSVRVVPEPTSAALTGLGLVGLISAWPVRRRRS